MKALPKISVETVSTDTEFRNLRHDWNELLEADERATVFQTWEFQYHARRMEPEPVDPYLVVIRDARGQLLGCAPLGIRVQRARPFDLRILGFVCNNYSDYSDFIVSTEHAGSVLAAIARWFGDNVRQWDMIQLRSVRQDSWLMQSGLFLDRLGLPARAVRNNTAPFLRFDPTWETCEDALSKKRASAIRYKVRKLLRRTKGDFEVVSSGRALEEAVEEMMQLHTRRMHEKNQIGAFATPQSRSEFRALTRLLGDRGIASVHSVRSKRAAISSICTFQFRGSVAYYQGGFDTSYRHLSPGQVTHALRISESIKAGAEEYDFLLGDEPYKYFWANGNRPIFTIEIDTGSRRPPVVKAWQNLRTRLAKSPQLRALNAWLHARR